MMDLGDQLVDNQRKAQWRAEVWPTIRRVCLRHGCDPLRCYEEAARKSTAGKHGLHHNWWQLPGAGDAGFVSWVRLVPSSRVGGVSSDTALQASFSSLTRAVEAWCRQTKKKAK